MMRVLKVVFLSFISLLLLLIIALIIFFKTFDLNKHLPQIASQVSTSLGRDFNVEQASLGFSFTQGIVLQISNMALADDPVFSSKPFFTVDRVEVGLNLRALLWEHRIQVTDIFVDAPRVVIIRSAEGAINVAGIGKSTPPAGSFAGQPDTSGKAQKLPAEILALLVKNMEITGAEVTFIDRMVSPELVLRIDQLDFQVNDLSLSRPFHGMVKASVFAKMQNLKADADFALDIAKQAVHVTGFKAALDISMIDLDRLKKELPMVNPAGLKILGGVVTLAADDMSAGARGLSALKGQVSFEKGEVASALMPDMMKDIYVKADIDAKNINVKNFEFSIAGGKVKGTAMVSGYMGVPDVSAVFSADSLDLEALLVNYKLPIKMSGSAFASGDVKFSGKTPDGVMASLKADAQAEIKNGRIDNVNLLSLGVGKIPMLPGVLDSVMAWLPVDIQKDANQGITHLDICNAKLHVADGDILVSNANMMTPDLEVQGQGKVKLSGPVEFKVDVHLAKTVSDRLVEKANDLAGLKDEQGRIYLPINISGTLLKVKVQPDMQYLAKKMIASQGGDALQQVFGTPKAADAVNAVLDLFKKK
ncbi:MAG: AsmA family protein [Candidatus Omnitrophota bacterium]